MRHSLIVFVACCLTAFSAAPQDVAEPPRPKLDSAADTNDWSAYHVLGLNMISKRPKEAADAFYWASRLDPTFAEPLYYRWHALWMSNDGLRRKYMKRDRKTLASGVAERIDSLRLRAMFRDPFVIGLDNPAAFSFRPSIELTRKYLAKQPENVALRVHQAMGFYRTRQFDSTIAHIEYVIGILRKLEQKAPAGAYESTEFLEYAMGRAHLAADDVKAAREAFERALAEDFSFYPAHAAIARIAWSNRADAETATREYDLAIELNPLDGSLRQEYGGMLLQASRFDEAVFQLEQSLELEPYFAATYFNLGIAYDHLGKDEQTSRVLSRFVTLAPRTLAPYIEKASARIVQLAR